MSLVITLIFGIICSVAAAPPTAERIVGGYATDIQQYPYAAAVLYSTATAVSSFQHICGATILNSNTFLSAAHCFFDSNVDFYRIRIGSSNARTGGTLLRVNQFTIHPDYVAITRDSDVAIIKSATTFSFNNNIRPAVIASFVVEPEELVWAVGFGDTTTGTATSDELRHVQIWTVNQTECTDRYAEGNIELSEDMLCAGWLNFGGRGSCLTDAGGPLVNNGIVVGVSSFAIGCANPAYPGVYSRVSSYFTWIQSNL